ncbi:iron-containing redox enzyme family protein [Streptomyces evansiae]|uniref:iron-containing redox enzyme family protein n=1 Tax=Streptomyces evansiae TaxID=3075535 RepID=UPI002886C678|nr:iron-containing redox enzyme family protein [Streptomyces sp. DSM 41859]MDT0424009.1 iron-containing redox enzyme family protein [Streptomyces sp. DSM 41859]
MMTATGEVSGARWEPPELPEARGDLSAHLLTALRAGRDAPPWGPQAARVDPLGEDLQLALFVLYGLQRGGWAGLPPTAEWEPLLLGLRRPLERRFLEALRGLTRGAEDVSAAFADLLVQPEGGDPTSVSGALERDGKPWQIREYAVLRAPARAFEDDGPAWALPRLPARPRAGLLSVLHARAGHGQPARGHAALAEEHLRALGLDPAPGRYVDAVPAASLALANLGALFGLHGALRGALVGHAAAWGVLLPRAAGRVAAALERTDAPEEARRYLEARAEAGAAEEQVLRSEVLAQLLLVEPGLEADVVLGIEATSLLEDRLAAHALTAWGADESALRLPVAVAEN